jgi:hypothetical protein
MQESQQDSEWKARKPEPENRKENGLAARSLGCARDDIWRGMQEHAFASESVAPGIRRIASEKGLQAAGRTLY